MAGSSTASETASSAASPLPSIGRTLVFGALLAAAWGALELTVRLGSSPSPSEGRRAPEILAHVVGSHALGGALCGLFAAVLARVWRRRGGLVLSACALSLVLFAGALWWLGDLRAEGKELWLAGRRYRFGALALAFLGALLAGLLLAALLRSERCRGLRSLLRPRRLALFAALLAVFAGAAVLLRGERAARSEEFVALEEAVVSGRPRHVLVVLVDTLRADALGCYGGAPGATPHTDALAQRGTLFEAVQAPASWTLPSVATLLSGESPASHGVGEFSAVFQGPSIAQALSATHDATAFVGNPLLASLKGFDRDFRLFDMYDYAVESSLFLPNAVWEVARLLGLVEYRGRKNHVVRFQARAPFLTTRLSHYPLDADLVADLERWATPRPDRASLTYLHLVAPHDPYLASPLTFWKEREEMLVANVSSLRARYAQEVQRFDRALGDVLALYERAGVLQDTLVVLTSDHGEEFHEHGGFTHGHTLYEEVVRVPLILAGPGVAVGRRVERRVQLADVAPTLLSLLGREPLATMQGSDLSALVAAPAGRGTDLPDRHFAELTSEILNPGRRVFSVVQGHWKIVREHLPDGRVLEQAFDLESDPQELEALPTPDELQALRDQLIDYEELAVQAAEGQLSPEALEAMRALGYVDSGR